MEDREEIGRLIEIDLREVGYEGETCLELAWDRFQWQAFVLVVLKLRVLLENTTADSHL